MKRLFTLCALCMAILVSSCQFDDTQIWDKLNEHEQRITDLEELCKKMNTNIDALQTMVEALEERTYITHVTEARVNGEVVGFVIIFSNGSAITVYHGTDGKDGYTPNIGVKQGSDGIYYWTVDGKWLLDEDDNKVRATGTDGKDGQDGVDGADGADGKDGQDGADGADGEDGVIPQLKIENGYWYVSYDDGASWSRLGRATGEDGKDGQDGKDAANDYALFQGVDTSNSDYVVFTLADGTKITIPTWYAFEQLQTLCNQMNTNISALQTLVNALQNNDYIESITPIMENGKEVGYTIVFTKSNPITIYHGKDGADGEDGTDSEDGADGHTPQIGVRMDADGIYYWTVDGEWLLDDSGKKIKAVGRDGQDGEDGTDGADGKDGDDGADGKDGITPQLKIDAGYWYVSYNNGATWQKLGKATGDSAGSGDSLFSSVTQDENNVYFTLTDGTQITIPLASSYLFNRIQSITYVPKYSDGIAYVVNGMLEMDYHVSPKSIVNDIANNWQSILSLKAIYTVTRAVSYVDMPVTSCVADAENGIITIKASASNLSDDFFDNEQTANVVLHVSDGNNDITSDYTPIAYVSVPNNEIWYTSSDGNIVTPFETNVFGANITSNKYNNGMGVITFDGDVTTIGDDAFRECTNLTSVNIPDSVTSIGGSAFYQSSLTSVTIPDSVTTIGEWAFGHCYSLTSVNIGDSVTTIERYAFYACHRLTSVTIGDSVTTIEYDAFGHCDSLTSVTIPDSVTTIESTVFERCKSLTEFKGKFAEDNGRILVADGVLKAFAPAGITEYNIPDSVTEIEDYTFNGCTSLTNVTIPNSVITIGHSSFGYCTSLTSITIPDSVTEIENWAFRNCTSLTEFKGKFAEDNGRILVVDGVLKAFAPAGLIKYTIPDSVTTIGECTFYDCTSLISVTIPDSVTTIGRYAFDGCRFTSVTIPDSVTTIESCAFRWCSSLTSITIPDSVTKICDGAFLNCKSLTSVTIGDSVTTIGWFAFKNCNSLTSVYCKDITPPSLYTDDVFDYNGSGRKIYVPYESVEAYKSATNWSEYASAIVGYDFENSEVKEVQPYNEIWYTSSDGNVVEPNNTKAFGANITSNTYNNGKGVITFDGDVTAIGNYAFSECESLTGVAIPDSVTLIGEWAFAYCYSLTSVTIPDSVTFIASGAFSGCSSLTSVIIGDSVTSIGNSAFRYCSSLTSVTIPDSVTTIGNYAFLYCYSLTSVYCYATTPTALGGTGVFDDNASGRKIYVPVGSMSAYKSAEYWSEYADVILGYDSKGMIVE